MKKTLKSESATESKKIFSCVLFGGGIFLAIALNLALTIDYGFFGCMVPVFASLFESESELFGFLRKLGINKVRVLTMGVGLILMVMYYGGITLFSFLALLPLLLYSGKRGKLRLKYFFYVFYPTHLLLINFIAELL